MKSNIAKKLPRTIMYLFLIIMVVMTLYPILYIILGSFKTNSELVKGGLNIFPQKFLLDNYVEAWKMANFATYTVNSLFMSTMIMIGSLFLSSITGYVFARKEFFLKKLFFTLLVAFMFINIGSVTLRPLFNLAVKMNLNKSLIGVILISIGMQQATYIFLVQGYIKSIPTAFDEAAIMDGCGFFKIYLRVIFPLIKPVMATIALLSFKAGWNEYILPLIFTMTKPEIKPLTVGVVSLRNMGDGAAAWNIMFAGASLSIIPIIVVYIFASKYFMSGLTLGGVKG